jgi:hydroxymethylpyrimidine pyrophosphatase-like HAD family hydrolase
MRTWFHAVAIDYDGTLTLGRRPTDAVLAAMADARGAGLRIVLVTGRILSELRRDFPDVDAHVDAIVAENGGVVTHKGGGVRRAAPPLPSALADVLEASGVQLRRGMVLLATTMEYDAAVLAAVRRLGLECQLVQNRGELMVLPANTSKATGLEEALSDLGVSPHNCIGIGDAENDHSLLDACEVGVAVRNAIPALRTRADIVLEQENGAGIIEVLRDVVRGTVNAEPKRWQVELGTFDDGSPARIPASQRSILVQGASGAGKSYVAGLFAEGLLDLEYTICVLDLEGDHPALGERRGVVTVGGVDGLVPPEHVVRLIRHRLASVVVDLSLEPFETRKAYARTLLAELLERRADTGLPHWIIVDEAHVPLGPEFDAQCLVPRPQGLCLVTYRPEILCPTAATGHDIELDVRSPDVVILTRPGEPPRRFHPNRRDTVHVRHWHKYTAVPTAMALRFVFRGPGGPNGRTAGHLAEFDAELRAASDSVVRHHAQAGDFSRWIDDVFRDSTLAQSVAEAEQRLRVGSPPSRTRGEILRALEARYLDGRSA